MHRRHHMPFGAELGDGGVRFRLWAPGQAELTLLTRAPERTVAMERQDGGWFECCLKAAGPGTRYGFRLANGLTVPDPASRFQPDDVHGLSEVIDPGAFRWADGEWHGRPWEEAVIYELHVGAFTPLGSFRGVAERLGHIANLGVTAIELMPVADTPGRRNWGYDGAQLFAPESGYGRPDDLKALVQAAHAHGLMVLLDVVYNHFGPEGNYLHLLAPPFFTDRHHTPWGKAINFDGPEASPVRDFFVHNALYWLEEYNIDGLRLDAVHAIRDESTPDILYELGERVAGAMPADRHVHLVLENDRNEARYLARNGKGRPRHFVAQWNDDAHHALHVLLTGESDGYYADYIDQPADLLGRALTQGFAYQGEWSPFRKRRRGEPSDHLPPTAFVNFLQNHDQIGNRAFGERLDRLAPPAAVEAALAVLLLAPSPPMLFMGEEWAAAQPFLFFCDFGAELAENVRRGRRAEFARFRRFAEPAARAAIPDPMQEPTFAGSVLNWADPNVLPHRDRLAFCRHLLELRRREIVPRLPLCEPGGARHRAFGRFGLDVSWPLRGDGMLRLRANLGAEPCLEGAPAAAPGRTLFESAPLEPPPGDAVLPAWWVGWSIEEPGQP